MVIEVVRCNVPYIPILIIAVVILSFSIWQGSIAIHGLAVDRTENPVLFWGQVALLTCVVIVMGVAVARGDI